MKKNVILLTTVFAIAVFGSACGVKKSSYSPATEGNETSASEITVETTEAVKYNDEYMSENVEYMFIMYDNGTFCITDPGMVVTPEWNYGCYTVDAGGNMKLEVKGFNAGDVADLVMAWNYVGEGSYTYDAANSNDTRLSDGESIKLVQDASNSSKTPVLFTDDKTEGTYQIDGNELTIGPDSFSMADYSGTVSLDTDGNLILSAENGTIFSCERIDCAEGYFLLYSEDLSKDVPAGFIAAGSLISEK